MPHVSQEVRRQYDPGVILPADSVGTLNYLMTEEIIRYVEEHGLSYQTINDALGALLGAALEFYLQVAVPYERNKALQNGNVYAELRKHIVGTDEWSHEQQRLDRERHSFDHEFHHPNTLHEHGGEG